ncbi:MAG: patatin-like phospholipase family protein [Chloroflexi bacterium]|nr:patatin-like phospholipase family protein [Chloroflexota bacterium]
MKLAERLAAPGPKRILALDGGGVRGAISLGFLERMEAVLRERHQRPGLLLCDYFDLIGGTSTGAIIATGLALGMGARELSELFAELAGVAFERRPWLPWRRERFSARPFELQLRRMLGDRTLGGDDLRTGLCIVTKRADTGVTWRLMNHPAGPDFEVHRDIRVRDAVRASVAPPRYWMPTRLEVLRGEVAAFVDGGLSLANNPALDLFLIATRDGFPFRWPTGDQDLMLVSVGTGLCPNPGPAPARGALGHARHGLSMLMNDADWFSQSLLQAISRTPTPWPMGTDLDPGAALLSGAPALHYVRYNALLEAADLSRLGFDDLAPDAAALRDPFAAHNRFKLAAIGKAAAEQRVTPSHFPACFDVALPAEVRVPFATLADVAAIAAIADPVIRNLRITWFYHQVASELTRRLGGADATWFAFGTWASKTAGVTIRHEEVPAWARGLLLQDHVPGVLDALTDFVVAMSGVIAAGNLLVFEELAPPALAFLDLLAAPADSAALDAFIAGLAPESREGGRVEAAFRSWYAAAQELDGDRRAELILLGNCSAVYHEQQRLQSALEKALELPVIDALGREIEDGDDSLFEAALHVAGRLLRPSLAFTRREWRRFATRALMTYELPERKLRLGQDVLGPAPGVYFPLELRELELPALCALMTELHAAGPTTGKSASHNWAKLADRMDFIATLFRSRQQDLGLLAPPFSRAQVAAFQAGQLPDGPL